MMRGLMLVGLLVGLLGGTGLSWSMATQGTGLSDDLRQQASVRNGSASNGRIYVGGGLHGGK